MNEIILDTHKNIENSIATLFDSKNILINPIITAASSLLFLLVQIRSLTSTPDLETLKAKLISEINEFEKKVAIFEKNSHTVLAARYCLCTTIDEAILNTSWGHQSIWGHQTLLSIFHHETHGGENFYLILENCMKNISDHLALIEFLYLLLSLGFEGKFFGSSPVIRDEIRSRVFYKIRENKGITSSNLFLENTEPTSHIHYKKYSLKRSVIISTTLICFVGLLENYFSYNSATKILYQINKIGQESSIENYEKLIS